MDTRVVRTMVGLEIRTLRESQDLSLQQLSNMCNTSYSHLWKVETARVSVGLDLLTRIANALGVSLASIIGPACEKAYNSGFMGFGTNNR